MILDRIENADLYKGISKGILCALEYICKTDLSNLEPGKYTIDGDMVYANVSSYESKVSEQGSWEAHKKYIDVQYVVKGTEKIGYSNIKGMEISKEYDVNSDFMLLSGEGDFVTLTEGTFAIFFPEDVHMPGISVSDPAQVKKVVVKVKV